VNVAAKKKISKKKVARRVAPWAKSKMAQGTVTVTISLEHVFAALGAIGKRLDDPQTLEALRRTLDQVMAEKTAKKAKRKKPPRDPNLN
jgi:hypothetical protein